MDERTEDLLVRWVDGELSDAEREEVEVLLAHSAALRQTVADYRKIKRQVGALREEFRPAVAKRLQEVKARRRHLRLVRRLGYAAAIVLIFIVAGVFFLKRETSFAPLSSQQELAWGQMPVLVLPNGEKRVLPQSDTAVLWQEPQGDISIHSRTLMMENEGKEGREPVYYTMNIPYGGEYNLLLPDGTKIYLNAGTSLRYPDHFAGATREIFLSGEAFLEVARDTVRPFIVRTMDGSVRVLGTEFNVNAYDDEAGVVTTLVEGSVRFSDGEKRVVLRPGEQVATGGREAWQVREVDVAEYVGWKNGVYVFNRRTLAELMEIVERNYDVTVFFANEECESLRFSGDLKKYDDLGDFLRFIETSGDARFVVKDKTVTVYKK